MIPRAPPQPFKCHCPFWKFPSLLRIFLQPPLWNYEEEIGIAIPKQYPPESESQSRVISKTPFLSKLYESFICDWLMEVIRPFLDPDQFGVKGLSITHYLLKLIHFVHTSLDTTNSDAVITAFIDMSKAFNRVDHNLLIADLHDMKPSWLLRVIYSF